MKQDVLEFEQLVEMVQRSVGRSNEQMGKSSHQPPFAITEFSMELYVFVHVLEEKNRTRLVYQLPTQEQLLNDKHCDPELKVSKIQFTIRPSVKLQNVTEREE